MVIIEAQRAQAIRRSDRLHELQEEALADPIAFVERLQKGEDLKIPGRIKIPPLPVIDWSKYTLSGNPSVFGRRQLTRLSSKVHDFAKNGKLAFHHFYHITKSTCMKLFILMVYIIDYFIFSCMISPKFYFHPKTCT